MEKLLLIGINTREMINSGLKLNYTLYSSSYFSTFDTVKIKNEKHMLQQLKNKSCGIFEEKYDAKELLEFSIDYIDEVDYIIPISGVSPSDFKGKFKKYKRKIIGNKNIDNIENKFKFFKKIKKNFLTPDTFIVNDIEEAVEIKNNNTESQYIIKPIKGSGGYGICNLNNKSINQLKDSEVSWLIQEYVEGINLSSSVLGMKNKAKTIINTRLLTNNDLKNKLNFIYLGNILPLNEKSILTKLDNISIEKLNRNMDETSEELIKKFKLIGSNGVDYILSEKGLYVIEVNPRFQGTYECCENLLKINMLDAHIKACKDQLIDFNKNINSYCFKKIVYSNEKIKFNNINLNNTYDIPYPNVIIEKNQPLMTIIENNKNFEFLCKNIRETTEKINKNILKNTC